MAKTKGPLFSLRADGAIGKALVYFSWKGLNVVRTWVIPSNPQTTLQVAARAHLTAAADLLHTAMADAGNPLAEVDMMAYSRWANQEKTPRTWWNQACKNIVDTRVLGNTGAVWGDYTETDLTPATFDIILYQYEEVLNDLAAATFFMGTSPTRLIHQVVGTIVAGVSTRIAVVDLSGWMVSGTRYYFQVRANALDPCEGARSGIYTFVAA
jgi:hypothetical protein